MAIGGIGNSSHGSSGAGGAGKKQPSFSQFMKNTLGLSTQGLMAKINDDEKPVKVHSLESINTIDYEA